MKKNEEEFVNQILINYMKQDELNPILENGIIHTGLGPSIIKINSDEQINREGFWIIGLWVCFAINPKREDSYIYDCASGTGVSIEEALETAIFNWYTLTAPALFSLMLGRPYGEAVWIPDSDPIGITGWDIFSSPYGLKGAEENKRVIEEYCQNFPPILQMRNTLLNSLNNRPFNTVKLYYGFDGANKHSEVLINSKNNLQCASAIKSINWPKRNGYASFSQFLLLLQKKR